VRIPPDRLGDEVDTVVNELAHTGFEGKFDKGQLTVLVTNISPVGVGRIIHGTGRLPEGELRGAGVPSRDTGSGAGHRLRGAQVRRLRAHRPVDGLLHISQIMDDRVEVNEASNRLVGKDTKKELKVGDQVRARIVAISINDAPPARAR